ncbi:MAG: class I SAM-dependent methyltransferase, partial [Planctomycetes bacterium]|nr:class I SAM-dependent methyltransferase [Planctomycetota bacterium]
ASIGCGPALDVCRAVETFGRRDIPNVRVTLVDMDPAALDQARQQLETRIGDGQLDCVRENLFRLHRRNAAGELFGDSDFIVCTGLFDYLHDTDAAGLLQCMWRSLSPGGRLLVFNFAPANTSRAYMEWIGNWYLIYRDRRQMRALADQAGIPRVRLKIDAEATGVDLCWDARKPND